MNAVAPHSEIDNLNMREPSVVKVLFQERREIEALFRLHPLDKRIPEASDPLRIGRFLSFAIDVGALGVVRRCMRPAKVGYLMSIEFGEIWFYVRREIHDIIERKMSHKVGISEEVESP